MIRDIYRANSREVHRLSSLPSKMGHVIYGGVLLRVLGHTGKVMHGDRGNRRTEKATSQNIFEMTKIIDRGLISLQICNVKPGVNQTTFSFRNGLFSKKKVSMNIKWRKCDDPMRRQTRSFISNLSFVGSLLIVSCFCTVSSAANGL